MLACFAVMVCALKSQEITCWPCFPASTRHLSSGDSYLPHSISKKESLSMAIGRGSLASTRDSRQNRNGRSALITVYAAVFLADIRAPDSRRYGHRFSWLCTIVPAFVFAAFASRLDGEPLRSKTYLLRAVPELLLFNMSALWLRKAFLLRSL